MSGPSRCSETADTNAYISSCTRVHVHVIISTVNVHNPLALSVAYMRARVIRFKLADLLAERDWSAYRLAKESGIPQPTVYRLLEDVEAKDARISLRTLNSLCNALECKVTDLLEHEPDKPKRGKR